MAIINRMSRLFTADVHAVLDRIEEPVALLRQCIREMEEELADAERNIKALTCEREQITARQRQLDESLAEIEAQLDVCFESGEEDLARGLIRRRLEAQRLAKHLVARAESTDKELTGLQSALEENRARLESMRQKAELFEEDTRIRSRAFDDDDTIRHACVGEDEVEVAFLAEKKRRAER